MGDVGGFYAREAQNSVYIDVGVNHYNTYILESLCSMNSLLDYIHS